MHNRDTPFILILPKRTMGRIGHLEADVGVGETIVFHSFDVRVYLLIIIVFVLGVHNLF